MVRTWGAQRSVPAISKVAVKGDGQLSADSESKIALCAFFWQQVRGITTITKRYSKLLYTRQRARQTAAPGR